mmetsp:Transcript_74666/g.218765  ORF Transcript_74666/g.218765 Transcript_74666/m.218765 type:complete len:203 (+) Transcript_74666:1549-2157(+)
MSMADSRSRRTTASISTSHFLRSFSSAPHSAASSRTPWSGSSVGGFRSQGREPRSAEPSSMASQNVMADFVVDMSVSGSAQDWARAEIMRSLARRRSRTTISRLEASIRSTRVVHSSEGQPGFFLLILLISPRATIRAFARSLSWRAPFIAMRYSFNVLSRTAASARRSRMFMAHTSLWASSSVPGMRSPQPSGQIAIRKGQ